MYPSQYDEFLQKFWEQKRLEEYQQRRNLSRPQTTKLYVVLCGVLLCVLLSVVLVLFVFFDNSLWLKLLISITYIVIIMETYGRFLAIKVVECY